jgi:hypothetical protein
MTLLGGAAAAWPLGARAQEGKLVRLGYLDSGSGRPTDPVGANLRRQFVLGLRDLGYVEGRHFQSNSAAPKDASIVFPDSRKTSRVCRSTCLWSAAKPRSAPRCK